MYVSVVDLGSLYCRALCLGWNDKEQKYQLYGLVEVPSSGVEQGEITNTGKAHNVISEALQTLEKEVQVPIREISLVYNGVTLNSHNSWGIIGTTPVRGDPRDGNIRCVTEQDIERALNSATELRLSADLERLHEIPRCYKLDGHVVRSDVVGSNGIRLELEVHIITCLREAIKNLIEVTRPHYEPQEIVHSSIAAAYISLTADELEEGCLVMDMGYGSTSFQFSFEGQPLITESIELGGYHITRDIAEILEIPFAIAEDLKLQHGICWPAFVNQEEKVVTPGGATSMAKEITLFELCEILNARIEEIFEMICVRLQRQSVAKEFIQSVVLIGGSSLLYGMSELAEEIFESPARLGLPENPKLLIDPKLPQMQDWLSPQYTALFGLGMYWLDQECRRHPKVGVPFVSIFRGDGDSRKGNSISRFLEWLKRKFA